MPHIHTNPGEYDYTATAYIVYIDPKEGTYEILLHKHKKHNRFLPVGGHVETNETPWQAILKEIKEESGYFASQLLVLQDPNRVPTLPKVDHFPQPFLTQAHDITDDHWHIDMAYAFTTAERPQGSPKEGESNELLYLSIGDIKKLRDDQIFANSRATALHVLSSGMIENWDPVPAESSVGTRG